MKVEAERAYHQIILQILDQLEGEVSIHITCSFDHLFRIQTLNIPFDGQIILFRYEFDFVLYVY